MTSSLRLTGFGCILALAACGSPETTEITESAAFDASASCGAAERQGLVGQNVTVLNDAPLPENTRVNFPGAVVTQDFLPGRLNIDIGADDKIKRIVCG